LQQIVDYVRLNATLNVAIDRENQSSKQFHSIFDRPQR